MIYHWTVATHKFTLFTHDFFSQILQGRVNLWNNMWHTSGIWNFVWSRFLTPVQQTAGLTQRLKSPQKKAKASQQYMFPPCHIVLYCTDTSTAYTMLSSLLEVGRCSSNAPTPSPNSGPKRHQKCVKVLGTRGRAVMGDLHLGGVWGWSQWDQERLLQGRRGGLFENFGHLLTYQANYACLYINCGV